MLYQRTLAYGEGEVPLHRTGDLKLNTKWVLSRDRPVHFPASHDAAFVVRHCPA